MAQPVCGIDNIGPSRRGCPQIGLEPRGQAHQFVGLDPQHGALVGSLRLPPCLFVGWYGSEMVAAPADLLSSEAIAAFLKK
jgi:hypothetical protein